MFGRFGSLWSAIVRDRFSPSSWDNDAIHSTTGCWSIDVLYEYEGVDVPTTTYLELTAIPIVIVSGPWEHVNIKAYPKLNPNLNLKRLGLRV